MDFNIIFHLKQMQGVCETKLWLGLSIIRHNIYTIIQGPKSNAPYKHRKAHFQNFEIRSISLTIFFKNFQKIRPKKGGIRLF